MSASPHARDLAIPLPGTPGWLNAISDVPGVQVVFHTLLDPARDTPTFRPAGRICRGIDHAALRAAFA